MYKFGAQSKSSGQIQTFDNESDFNTHMELHGHLFTKTALPENFVPKETEGTEDQATIVVKPKQK